MCSSQSISGLISAAQHTEKTSVGWWWAGKHWEKPLNHFGSSSFPAEDALPVIPSVTGLFPRLSFLLCSCIPMLVSVFDVGNGKSKLSWCSRAACNPLTWLSRVLRAGAWHSTLELRIQTSSVVTSAFHIQVTFPALHYLKVKLSVFRVCLNCLRGKMV